MKRSIVLLCLLLTVSGVAAGDEGDSDSLVFSRGAGYGFASTFQVALADFDADGRLDAFFGNMDVDAELWLNQGNGRFLDSHQRFGHAVHGVGVGDLDGDSDLDLLLVHAIREVPSSIYLNDGSGRFRLGEELDDVGLGAGLVSLFDLEGDGDLDASVLRGPQESTIYVNDGTAHFERLSQVAPGLANWGDLDGDGDSDAVIVLAGGGFFTWMNQGGASFARRQEIPVPAPFFPGGTLLHDVDADGDLDLVACGAGFDVVQPLTVLLNRGDGVFTPAPEDRFPTFSGWIALGDFNGDGAIDVLASAPERMERIGLGDGSGGFVDAGVSLGIRRMPGLSSAGDLDGDGDTDIFLSQYDPAGPNVVWFNVTND